MQRRERKERKERDMMGQMLAVFDIDGTLRSLPDPWLHLHRHLGTAAQGEEFFRQWSTGAISYGEMAALDASAWKGVPRAAMLECLEANPLRRGARGLVAWFGARGIPCVGISSGLSVFNEITKKELGLDEVISNELLFEGEVCAGRCVVHVEEAGKAEVLKRTCALYGCEPGEGAIVFGDGMADVAMFELARLAVAVFPRSAEVAERASLVVEREPIDWVCEEVGRLLG